MPQIVISVLEVAIFFAIFFGLVHLFHVIKNRKL